MAEPITAETTAALLADLDQEAAFHGGTSLLLARLIRQQATEIATLRARLDDADEYARQARTNWSLALEAEKNDRDKAESAFKSTKAALEAAEAREARLRVDIGAVSQEMQDDDSNTLSEACARIWGWALRLRALAGDAERPAERTCEVKDADS